MKYICIGEIVGTHGLKGEVRLSSHFKYKDLVFVPNFKLYIGRKYEEVTVTRHRFHKTYDMVTFEGLNDINDVIIYKGDKVYINRDDVDIKDGYFDEDLIGMDVCLNSGKFIGKVERLMHNGANQLLSIVDDTKCHLVPHVQEFVQKIDFQNNQIIINEIKGLLNED